MKLINYLVILIAGISLISCVGEDIETNASLLDQSSLRLTRQLRAVAIDEEVKINVDFTDRDGNAIDVNNSNEFYAEYSTDKPQIATISDSGVLMPQENSLGQEVLVTIDIFEGNKEVKAAKSLANDVFKQESNLIIIGKVTISESEARQLPESEVDKIIASGYDPKVTIMNPLTKIDIDESDFSFIATYQNFKNQVEDVEIIWESSDTNILGIDNNGKLTPLAKGVSTITASTTINNTTLTDSVEVEVADETTIDNPDPADGKTILGFGKLESNSSYSVTGDFEIIEENGVKTIELKSNYRTGNVPDLVIYLSNDTTTNAGAQFISEDITPSGAQSFTIPQNVNVDSYSNVLLYCRRFGVRVGFGRISK